jgi:hypothetical protein
LTDLGDFGRVSRRSFAPPNCDGLDDSRGRPEREEVDIATIGRATWIRSFHFEVSSGRVFAEA